MGLGAVIHSGKNQAKNLLNNRYINSSLLSSILALVVVIDKHRTRLNRLLG